MTTHKDAHGHGHETKAEKAEAAALKAVPKVDDKVKYTPELLPEDEWAGKILAVHDNGTVDVEVQPTNTPKAPKEKKTGVPLVHGGEKPANGDYCTLV